MNALPPVGRPTGAEPVARGGIRLRGVTKTYRTGEAAVDALRGVDLDVAPGELVVMLGPSGSGKTTMVNIIGGIESPTSGQVRVAGRDLHEHPPARLAEFRRTQVGFVFQFFNLIPTLTARENVDVIVELTGNGDRAGTRRLLARVDLADRADHFPAQLSGGQQQRVAIARALATDPALVLADEPTGALDTTTGRQILSLLQESNRAGRTVVMVTHNAAIAGLADLVVRMHDGRIASVDRNPQPVAAAEVAW